MISVFVHQAHELLRESSVIPRLLCGIQQDLCVIERTYACMRGWFDGCTYVCMHASRVRFPSSLPPLPRLSLPLSLSLFISLILSFSLSLVPFTYRNVQKGIHTTHSYHIYLVYLRVYIVRI